MPPTLGRTQVSTVRKQIKLQLLSICKNPVSVEFQTQITTILSELGASSNEVKKIFFKFYKTPKLMSKIQPDRQNVSENKRFKCPQTRHSRNPSCFVQAVQGVGTDCQAQGRGAEEERNLNTRLALIRKRCGGFDDETERAGERGRFGYGVDGISARSDAARVSKLLQTDFGGRYLSANKNVGKNAYRTAQRSGSVELQRNHTKQAYYYHRRLGQ